jgi:acyl-CoA synthetase (AMP-forming)/AMP-acid ligase II
MFVGCLRAGRDFISIPLPGRGQTADRYGAQIENILKVSGATAIAVEAEYASILRSLPRLSSWPLLLAEELAEADASPFRSDPLPGGLVQFSSGTTGSPKGIRLSCEAIAASVEATLDALGVGERPESFCSWVPLSHDMGLIGGLLGTWAGCSRTRYRYTLLSPELFLLRPLAWLEACSRTAATLTAAPAFAYGVASRHLAKGAGLKLDSLKACIIGAEPIRAETLVNFAAAAGVHGLREDALCPAYGLAEATLAVSMVRPGERWKTRSVSVEGRNGRFVSCGRPLDCVTVDAPDGTSPAGPIRVAGPVLLDRYVPGDANPAGSWLETNDLGVLEGGELFVTGRSDDLLCMAGRHVFAWELEGAVHGTLDVRPGDVAVVADASGRYVVLLEIRPSAKPDFDKLLLAARKEVVAVAGIGPSAVACLPKGSILKTPSGKIQRAGMAATLPALLETSLAIQKW